MKDEKDTSSFFTCTLNFIRSNLSVLSVISTLVLVFLGWGIYHVSPLNTFEEIAYKQEQENLKRDYVQFHNDLGNLLLNVEQIDAAKREFEKSLEMDPLNQTARFSLFKCEVFGSVMNKTYDSEITGKQLEMILKESDNADPHAYLFLGDLHLFVNQSEALINYQKAINLDDSVAAAYAGMGYAYYLQDKHDKSVQMYEKALNISPWSQSCLNNLGYQYYITKDYQKAIDTYNKLLGINDKYLLSYYMISNSYRLIGDLESAQKYYEVLLVPLADKDIVDLKQNNRTWGFQIKSGEMFLYNFPEKKYYAYYNLALTHYLLGNERKTIEYFKRANDLHIDKDLETNVQKLVSSDIDNLQEEQPSLLNRSEEFRIKFLTQL